MLPYSSMDANETLKVVPAHVCFTSASSQAGLSASTQLRLRARVEGHVQHPGEPDARPAELPGGILASHLVVGWSQVIITGRVRLWEPATRVRLRQLEHLHRP